MMPLCGVTKQQNSLKCCNILAETSVKTHFHKRKQGTRLTKGGTRFFFQRDTREVSELHYLHSPLWYLFPCRGLFLFAQRTKVLPPFVQQAPVHMTVHFLHDLPKVDTIL